MLTGHFGNWEMPVTCSASRFPPNSVARALDNPYLDRYLKAFRERTGQKMIAKKGVTTRCSRFSGLAESSRSWPIRMPASGDVRRLLRRPASTHKAIALMAIEHNAPVVVGYARRIGPGLPLRGRLHRTVRARRVTGTADDARLLTQRYTSALEAIIRKDPEQYLWLHRRWKHQPKPKKKRAATEEAASIEGAA